MSTYLGVCENKHLEITLFMTLRFWQL